MAQRLNPHPATPGAHVSRLLHLPIQLPACGPESSGGRPKALGPCTRVGDPEAPGSWIEIGSAPATVAIWGVNPRMEDLSVCISFCKSAFPIKIKFFFYKF